MSSYSDDFFNMPNPEPWKGKSVLIVEDDEVSLLLLKEFLQDTELTIYSAISGEEAVAIFERHPDIDLVLMDLQLPEMNGFEAFEAIKKINKEVPVVAQTAFYNTEMRNRCRDAGFAGFLPKPLVLTDCVNELKKHLA